MTSYEERMMARHFEVVSYSSFIGLFFPIIFLLIEKDKISPEAFLLIWPFGGLFLLLFLSFLFIRGELFTVPTMILRLILYAVGFFIIIFSGLLIDQTGGIQSSLFVWMLEYSLLLALITRDGRWRSVIWVFMTCLLVILILVLNPTKHTISTHLAQSTWGGIAVSLTLVLALFSAFVADKLYSKEKQETESKDL